MDQSRATVLHGRRKRLSDGVIHLNVCNTGFERGVRPIGDWVYQYYIINIPASGQLAQCADRPLPVTTLLLDSSVENV